MSPAIPILAAVARMVEKTQEVMSRGKRHSVPSKDKDIALLMSNFMDDKVHVKIIGRHTKTTARDVPVNVIVAGISKLIHKNGLDEWWSNRAGSFPGRKMSETWPDANDEAESGTRAAVQVAQVEAEDAAFEVDDAMNVELYMEWERQQIQHQIYAGLEVD